MKLSAVSDIQICSPAHQSGNRGGTLRLSEYNRGKKTNVRSDGVGEGVIK